MLKMRNWCVPMTPMERIGFSGEHDARLLEITIDEPAMDYSWKLETELNGEKNIIDLNREGNILSVLLTRDMLRAEGECRMQVRGVRGEEIKKSNVFYVTIGQSINAVNELPPLEPSEFAQMEQRITVLKADVERLTASASASEQGAAKSLAQTVQAAAEALEATQDAWARAQAAAQSAGDAAASGAAADAARAAAEASLAQALQAVAAAEAARDAALASSTTAQDAANRAAASAQAIAGAQQAAEAARDAAKQAAQDAADALAGIQPAKEQAIDEIKTEGAAQIGAAAAQANRASDAAGQAAESAETSRAAADRAENAAIHQPYPDETTGTWWVWDMDAGKYRDSGIRAKADELKIASPDVLGGVQPVAKDDTMTIPVGVDSEGKLHAGKDPEVNRLKDDIAAKAASDKQTAEKLDALWKLNQGISYDFVTDSEDAYDKIVPAGCKYAAVESIGGKTAVVDGQMTSALVENVVSQGKNLFDFDSSFLVESYGDILEPHAICGGNGVTFGTTKGMFSKLEKTTSGLIVCNSTELRGPYLLLQNAKSGETYALSAKISNAVVFNVMYLDDSYKTVYSKNLTFSKFGEMVMAEHTIEDIEYCHVVFGLRISNKGVDVTIDDIMLTKNTTDADYVKYRNPVICDIPPAVLNLPGYGWSAGDVCNSIERTDDGWQYVQRVDSREYQEDDSVTDGVTTYYELDEPIITDITDLMGKALDLIAVEPGGTLTLENAANLSVPSTVQYIRSLKEVDTV